MDGQDSKAEVGQFFLKGARWEISYIFWPQTVSITHSSLLLFNNIIP